MKHLSYSGVYLLLLLCINSNKQQSIKAKPIASAVVRIFKEVSEVGQTVKASHETCDNCLEYGNKANPSVGKESNPKTTILVLA